MKGTGGTLLYLFIVVTFGFQGNGLRELPSSCFVSGSNSNDDEVGVKLET